MKVFYCDDHAYFWPVGVCSIVVAENEEQAREFLCVALNAHGLNGDQPFTLHEVDTSKPSVEIVNDGNY